jgi:hypothetical protein
MGIPWYPTHLAKTSSISKRQHYRGRLFARHFVELLLAHAVHLEPIEAGHASKASHSANMQHAVIQLRRAALALERAQLTVSNPHHDPLQVLR